MPLNWAERFVDDDIPLDDLETVIGFLMIRVRGSSQDLFTVVCAGVLVSELFDAIWRKVSVESGSPDFEP